MLLAIYISRLLYPITRLKVREFTAPSEPNQFGFGKGSLKYDCYCHCYYIRPSLPGNKKGEAFQPPLVVEIAGIEPATS